MNPDSQKRRESQNSVSPLHFSRQRLISDSSLQRRFLQTKANVPPGPKHSISDGANRSEIERAFVGVVINNRFKVQRKIGSGSFGVVFRGADLLHRHHVSLKFELLLKRNRGRSTRIPYKKTQLFNEFCAFQKLENLEGFPKVHYFGRFKDFSVLVLDLLGPNLEEVFRGCTRKFSPKSLFMLAIKSLELLEAVHSQGIVHRDVKPANFLVGRGAQANRLFLVDFGLSRPFRLGSRHLPLKETGCMSGTARYASLGNHRGYTQSRRDDLEALANCLVYFAVGKLPWMGLQGKGGTPKHVLIGEKKAKTPVEEVCKGTDTVFRTMYTYVRSLKFEEKPDYNFLKGLFKKALVEKKLFFDLLYDWVSLDRFFAEATSPGYSKRYSLPLQSSSSAHTPGNSLLDSSGGNGVGIGRPTRGMSIGQPIGKETDIKHGNNIGNKIISSVGLVELSSINQSLFNSEVNPENSEEKKNRNNNNSNVSVFEMNVKMKEKDEIDNMVKLQEGIDFNKIEGGDGDSDTFKSTKGEDTEEKYIFKEGEGEESENYKKKGNKDGKKKRGKYSCKFGCNII